LGDSLAGANGQSARTAGGETAQFPPEAMEVAPGSNDDWVIGAQEAENARMAATQRSGNWYAGSGMPAGDSATWMPSSTQRSYTATAGQGPLAIADNLDADNRYAVTAYVTGTGQMSFNARPIAG